MISVSPKKSLSLFEEHIDFLANEDAIGIKYGATDVDNYLLPLQATDLGFVISRPGHAKCMGRNTKVVMYDGSVRNIQDISRGDLLMGPDSSPRKVLSTTSGYDKMYWIKQKKGGINYLVNGNHILSLMRSKNEGKKRHGEIKNISVNDVLSSGKSFLNRWKGYKVSIDFPEKKQALDPYFLGLWLGDGTKNKPEITNADSEVLDYLLWFSQKNGYNITYRFDNRGNKAYVVSLTNSGSYTSGVTPELRNIGVFDNKHIPDEYIYVSKDQRLSLLAGFIDADGTTNDGTYDIAQKDEKLLRQVKFVADTLGFRTSWGKPYVVNDVPYYRLNISGNVWEIPCLIERKKYPKQKNRRVDQSVNGIEIEYHGIDEYFGFELSGDGLYLLEDMTVTHNTSTMTHYAFRAADLHIQSQGKSIEYGPPIFISLEMPIEALMVRAVSKFAKIDSKFILTGKSAVDWDNVRKQAGDMIDEFPIIYIGNSLYDKGGKRTQGFIEDITQELERVVDRIGVPPSIVCVDYIQRIASKNGPKERRVMMNEYVERFKDLATYLKAPFLVGSQALRQVDERKFPVPQIQDGKETGGIEEAADWVISGMRPSRYWDIGSQVPNSSQIVTQNLFFMQVLKQRNGDAGKGFWLEFDPTIGEFDELSSI